MTLLIHDGFDDYDSGFDPLFRGPWGTQSTAQTFSDFSIRPNATGKYAALYSTHQLVHWTTADQSGKTLYIGMAFKNGATGTNGLLKILRGTTINSEVQLFVRIEDESIKVYRGDGTTLLGTGVYTIVDGNWYWVEFKIKIDNTTGIFECKFGTAIDISLSNIDTQQQATDSVWGIQIESTQTYLAVDDVYICNSDGTTNNGYLGECKSEKIFPNSDNTVAWSRSGGTTNYENIDETFDPDNDTSYVYSTTPAQKDLYDMQDLSDVGSGIVHGVRVETYSKKHSNDWKAIKSGIKYNTTEQLGVENSVTSDYAYLSDIFETSDGSTTAWTETTVNAALLVLENQQ